MDISAGMVTRSRRRLSDVSETKNDDNLSTCSTPTKKRGRRLSSNLNSQELETDLIPNSDKTESTLESSDAELVKKDLPLHVINNIMDSPSRNLRKRNISPMEIKSNENATPNKAVKKLDNLLIQNIVDSPKLRKNKRLSGGSDMDGSQELPAVRRSRRLSGELNVVLEDPIKEELPQESYKTIAGRRGKRLSMMPLQPTLPEESEEAIQLSLGADSDNVKDVAEEKVESVVPKITSSVLVEKVSTDESDIQRSSQKTQTATDSNLKDQGVVADLNQSPQKKRNSIKLSTPTNKHNENLEFSKCSPMEVDESLPISEDSPNKNNRSIQRLSLNKLHNKSKQESPVKDHKEDTDSVMKSHKSPKVYVNSESEKLSQNKSGIKTFASNGDNVSLIERKDTEPSLTLNLEMSCDEDKTSSAIVNELNKNSSNIEEDILSDVIPSSQDDTVDFSPPKIKPVIKRSLDTAKNSSCDVIDKPMKNQQHEAAENEDYDVTSVSEKIMKRKSLNKSVDVSTPESQSRKSLNAIVQDFSPQLQSRKSIHESDKQSTPLSQNRNSLNEFTEKTTQMLEDNKSINESVNESTPQLQKRRSLNESVKESSLISQDRDLHSESVKVSTPLTQSRKSLGDSVKESTPPIQSRKSLNESVKQSSPLLRSRNSLSESVKETTSPILTRKSLAESIKESTPPMQSRKSLNDPSKESSPLLRSRISVSESVRESTPPVQSRKSLNDSTKQSSPLLRSRNSLNEFVKETTSPIQSRKSLNDSVKGSSPLLQSRKSLHESVKESTPSKQDRKSLSESVKGSTPLLRSRKSLNESNKESSPRSPKRNSLNEIVEELSPKLQGRKSSNDTTLELTERKSLNKCGNSSLTKDSDKNASLHEVDNDLEDSDDECVKETETNKNSSFDKKTVSSDEESDENDDVDMKNEPHKNDDFIKLQLVEESASEAESDYKSGDSMDSSEIEEMVLNEVTELGESLHSDSNENESDASSYEKDSFVCSDEEEVEIASADEGTSKEPVDSNQVVEDRTTNTDAKQCLESDASSERKVEGMWMVSPLKTSTEDTLSSNPRKRKLPGENKTSAGRTNTTVGFNIANDVTVERPTCPVTASDFGSTTSFNIIALKKSPKHILTVDPKTRSTTNFKENMLYGSNIKRKDSKSNKNAQQKIKASLLSRNK